MVESTYARSLSSCCVGFFYHIATSITFLYASLNGRCGVLSSLPLWLTGLWFKRLSLEVNNVPDFSVAVKCASSFVKAS